MANADPITTPIEEWRDIPGYEGLYQVSDHGRVRSLDRIVPHKNHGEMKVKGRVLAQPHDEEGRRQVVLSKENGQTIRRVHQLVLEVFVGPRPDGYHGCHNDGDNANNRLTNLRWDTASENNFDLVRHGTHWNGKKQFCKHGHEFTPENTIRPKYNPRRRACRECGRIANRKSSAKRRAAAKLK